MKIMVVESKSRILLVGLMASGKSSIGKSLAKLTGWDFLDNDDLVLKSAGANKQKLIDEQGVDSLRKHERMAFDEVLKAPAPVIGSRP